VTCKLLRRNGRGKKRLTTMLTMATSNSALAAALARVGDRWTLLIIEALLAGPRRFNELSTELSGIAANVLSQRLKHLEHEGLVIARPYSERPPRLEYTLTGAGAELAGALRLLAQWGARTQGAGDLPRHAACGSPLEARWYCPTCARVVDDHDDAELRFL
jgi:DNA-binding HxlR family transcriptional regulator